MKVNFEKFDVEGSFTMWKAKIEDFLVQNELDLALEDRPKGMTDR